MSDRPSNTELADRLADSISYSSGTHSTECWKWHWECLKRLVVERLRTLDARGAGDVEVVRGNLKKQRKAHKHWLDNLPHGTQVWGHGGANGESFWTRCGETDNGVSFWTSGLNTVSSPTLARICDTFMIAEQPIMDREYDKHAEERSR